MANVLDRTILLDGPRNAIVKLSGVIDSADVFLEPAVALDDFETNESNATLTGFRVDEVEYSISDPLMVGLEWEGLNPQQIAPLSGRGEICFHDAGGLLPDTTRQGYNGTINLRTLRLPPGTVGSFIVLVELVKLYN